MNRWLSFVYVSFYVLLLALEAMSYNLPQGANGRLLASIEMAKLRHANNGEMRANNEVDEIKEVNCVNPSEKYLRRKLAYAYTYFTQEIISSGVYTPIVGSEGEDFKMKRRRIVKSCLDTNETAWSRQSANTCPYSMERVNRVDHYPFTQHVAVCHCKEACSQLPREVSKKFGCFPDYIALPVLKRRPVCPPSGVYQFKAMLEYVPVSCSCREKQKKVYT